MRNPRSLRYFFTRPPRGYFDRSASVRYLPVRKPLASAKYGITARLCLTQTASSAALNRRGRGGAGHPAAAGVFGMPVDSGGVHRRRAGDLMQGLAVLLEMGGLQVEPRLPEGEALRRELRQVRWEISASGRDLFGGEKEHDDLAMAVAMGFWWGRRG